jgi:hypothetical protein
VKQLGVVDSTCQSVHMNQVSRWGSISQGNR